MPPRHPGARHEPDPEPPVVAHLRRIERLLVDLAALFATHVEWVHESLGTINYRSQQTHNLMEHTMAKVADLEAHLDELAGKVTTAVTELKDALAKLLAQIAELPGNENVDTSEIDAAVDALSALGSDPDSDGTPGLPGDGTTPEPV